MTQQNLGDGTQKGTASSKAQNADGVTPGEDLKAVCVFGDLN